MRTRAQQLAVVGGAAVARPAMAAQSAGKGERQQAIISHLAPCATVQAVAVMGAGAQRGDPASVLMADAHGQAEGIPLVGAGLTGDEATIAALGASAGDRTLMAQDDGLIAIDGAVTAATPRQR